MNWGFSTAAMIGASVMLYLLIFMQQFIAAEAACLRVGYPTAHVTWDLVEYCTREENEYEVTVTLEQARGRQD